jgi:hypothetical protein
VRGADSFSFGTLFAGIIHKAQKKPKKKHKIKQNTQRWEKNEIGKAEEDI